MTLLMNGHHCLGIFLIRFWKGCKATDIYKIKSTINKILLMRIKSTVYKGFKLPFAKLHVLQYLCDRKLMEICQFIFTAQRVHLKS